jgi:hypothetical protein
MPLSSSSRTSPPSLISNRYASWFPRLHGGGGRSAPNELLAVGGAVTPCFLPHGRKVHEPEVFVSVGFPRRKKEQIQRALGHNQCWGHQRRLWTRCVHTCSRQRHV